MGARLDAAEAGLREMIASLDTGLRVHVQEAVAQTQQAVQSLGERLHLLDTARDRSASSAGFVSAEARAAVEAADTRRRFSELELRLLGAETTTTEQRAERLGAERDLCTGLSILREDPSRLEAQTGGSTAALDETLTGLVVEAQRLKSKLASLGPGHKDDPWSGDAGPKGPLDSNNGGGGSGGPRGGGGLGPGGGGGGGPPGGGGFGPGGPPGFGGGGGFGRFGGGGSGGGGGAGGG